MIFRTLILSLLLFCAATETVYAFKLHLGVGSLSPYLGKMQTDEKGGSNGLDFNPMLLVGAPFDIKWKYWPHFSPELGIGIPGHGESEHISKWHYFIQGVFWYQLHSWRFRLGAGFAMTRISSDGGTIDMPDGNSTTTFFLPPTSSTSRNVIVPFGVEYHLENRLFFRIDGQLYNSLSSDKRATSVIFSVHHPFTINWGKQ